MWSSNGTPDNPNLWSSNLSVRTVNESNLLSEIEAGILSAYWVYYNCNVTYFAALVSSTPSILIREVFGLVTRLPRWYDRWRPLRKYPVSASPSFPKPNLWLAVHCPFCSLAPRRKLLLLRSVIRGWYYSLDINWKSSQRLSISEKQPEPEMKTFAIRRESPRLPGCELWYSRPRAHGIEWHLRRWPASVGILNGISLPRARIERWWRFNQRYFLARRVRWWRLLSNLSLGSIASCIFEIIEWPTMSASVFAKDISRD